MTDDARPPDPGAAVAREVRAAVAETRPLRYRIARFARAVDTMALLGCLAALCLGRRGGWVGWTCWFALSATVDWVAVVMIRRKLEAAGR